MIKKKETLILGRYLIRPKYNPWQSTSEVTIEEISPSGSWIKVLLSDDKSTRWLEVSEYEIIEELYGGV